MKNSRGIRFSTWIWSFCCLLPALAAADPLSLEECIARAFANSPLSRSNQQDLERSHLRLQQRRAPFAPQAEANMVLPSYSESRELLDDPALTARVRNENTNLQYLGSLELSQRVRSLGRFTLASQTQFRDFSSNRQAPFRDYAGDLRLDYTHELFTQPAEEIGLAQAELDMAGAELGFRRAQLQLESTVTEAYYALVRALGQLDIAGQSLEQSRASLDLARRKVEVGFIAETEALRLQVDMLRAEANYAQRQNDIERARDELRELIGLDWDEPLEPAGLPGGHFQKYSIPAERAVAVGLSRRLDLKESQIQEEVQKLGLKNTRRQMGPLATLNARVSLRGQGDEVGEIPARFERNLWGMDIRVAVPLIDGGQRRSQVRQQELALEQLRTDREILRHRVVRQIRDALNNLRRAERQLELSRTTVEVAQLTFEREQRRFDLGLVDSQDLLNAQTQFTAARIEALNALIDYHLALKNLRLYTMAELGELAE